MEKTPSEETKQDSTWKDALAKWNSGDTVATIELGGIGPGYEQCIQILVFEHLNRWSSDTSELKAIDGKLPKEFHEFSDKITTELDKQYGFSGAQVAVAKSLAWAFLSGSYANILDEHKDRMILVSKNFPV